MNNFKTIFLIIFLAMLMAACSNPLAGRKPPKPDVINPAGNINNKHSGTASGATIKEQLAAQSKIQKFSGIDELADFLESNQDSSQNYAGISRRMAGEDMIFSENIDVVSPMSAEATMAQGLAEKSAAPDYSETNVQVAGVDEADIIKSDGKYIYALVKNNVFIIEAYPAENAKILSKIEFKDRPQDIYINGNSLVVFGEENNIWEKYDIIVRRGPYSFFKVFDIKDKKNPQQVRDLDIEGSYFNSRMIDDYVYFAVTNYNYYYMDDAPVLPRVFAEGEALDNSCDKDGKCFMPDVYYFDMPYNNFNFSNVYAINIVNNNQKISGEAYLMNSGQNMYVSPENMYITYTKYINEQDIYMESARDIVWSRLSSKNQERINKIEQTENFILSKNEKKQKINYILERYIARGTRAEQEKLQKEIRAHAEAKYKDISKELEKTVIHKIAIKKGTLEYQGSGEVTGHVLNQFSMDEADGYLRIATTKNRTRNPWFFEDTVSRVGTAPAEDRKIASPPIREERESYNNMYVLDKNLKVVGALEDLAKGERIYSVRFMQGRAYMVTFEQTDPLFVIDLSNPKNPKVLGKLKIPGFSNYLHPYDDDTLIGIGKDTSITEFGSVKTKGIKISLFDVSDVSSPKEKASYVIGEEGSNSIALNDHKAFLFAKDKNLLVLPVSINETYGIYGRSSYPRPSFSGAAVFNITKDSINLQGKIDHSDNGKASGRDYWHGYNYYDNTVKRSLYIDNVLYTFSNNYIKMNKLDNLDLIKNMPLKKEKAGPDDDYKIIN